jgi:hypothetical protein
LRAIPRQRRVSRVISKRLRDHPFLWSRFAFPTNLSRPRSSVARGSESVAGDRRADEIERTIWGISWTARKAGGTKRSSSWWSDVLSRMRSSGAIGDAPVSMSRNKNGAAGRACSVLRVRLKLLASSGDAESSQTFGLLIEEGATIAGNSNWVPLAMASSSPIRSVPTR